MKEYLQDISVKRTFVLAALLLYGTSSFGADLSIGKSLSSQCSVCHGKDGIAKDPESPNLAGQSALYLEKSLIDYQKGTRQDRRMSIIAKTLSIEDIKNLAAWYAAFELTAKAPDI